MLHLTSTYMIGIGHKPCWVVTSKFPPYEGTWLFMNQGLAGSSFVVHAQVPQLQFLSLKCILQTFPSFFTEGRLGWWTGGCCYSPTNFQILIETFYSQTLYLWKVLLATWKNSLLLVVDLMYRSIFFSCTVGSEIPCK